MQTRGLYESTKNEAVDTEVDNTMNTHHCKECDCDPCTCEDCNCPEKQMPSHYGKKKPMGKKKPKKNGKKKRKGLTAKQKKLPPALRAAILKRQRKG